MMNENKKQMIAFEAIKILKSRYDSFPDNTTAVRNAPFHKAFLRAFESRFDELHTNSDALLNVSSWIHGLNTTLGQSFFEGVAHNLCEGDKKSFPGSEYKLFAEQERVISEHMTDLKNGTIVPDTDQEDEMLRDSATGKLVVGANFTADCFFEDEEKIVAIELKSVRPNSGETRGEKQKILKAKAALRHYYSSVPGCEHKSVYYFFGFPFDPTAPTDTGSNKENFMENMIEFSKFCAPEDILLADELWSFLSGEPNTMAEILNIIKDISDASFSDDFSFLCSAHSIQSDPKRYRRIVSKWHLCEEVKFVDRWNDIDASTQRDIIKYKNASPFGEDGRYNEKRMTALRDYLHS